MARGPKRDLEVPEGLQEFLQTFVVAILRSKPDDLLELGGGLTNRDFRFCVGVITSL